MKAEQSVGRGWSVRLEYAPSSLEQFKEAVSYLISLRIPVESAQISPAPAKAESQPASSATISMEDLDELFDRAREKNFHLVNHARRRFHKKPTDLTSAEANELRAVIATS